MSQLQIVLTVTLPPFSGQAGSANPSTENSWLITPPNKGIPKHARMYARTHAQQTCNNPYVSSMSEIINGTFTSTSKCPLCCSLSVPGGLTAGFFIACDVETDGAFSPRSCRDSRRMAQSGSDASFPRSGSLPAGPVGTRSFGRPPSHPVEAAWRIEPAKLYPAAVSPARRNNMIECCRFLNKRADITSKQNQVAAQRSRAIMPTLVQKQRYNGTAALPQQSGKKGLRPAQLRGVKGGGVPEAMAVHCVGLLLGVLGMGPWGSRTPSLAAVTTDSHVKRLTAEQQRGHPLDVLCNS